jgi:hypothetical protein
MLSYSVLTRQKTLLKNYTLSSDPSVTFPLMKESADSYLKYLESFPFWCHKNPYIEHEICCFSKRFGVTKKKGELNVTFRVDSGQRLQLPLIQLQNLMPTIYDRLKDTQTLVKPTIQVHLKNVTFDCLSSFISSILNPHFVTSKWFVSYDNLLQQIDFSLSVGSLDMVEFWYNCFVFMVPTLSGKMWLKIQLLRRFRLFGALPTLHKALAVRFEQFILDPLWTNLSSFELSAWLNERVIGVCE